MTEPKVVRYAVTCHPERIVISEDGAWVQHHDYARLAARVQELETEHCRDCCCARAWEALDVAEYDGKSIPEHIILLRDYAAEQSDLAADRKDEIRHHKAENQRLREALGEYGHHKPHCKLDPCDCGILEALKEKS